MILSITALLLRTSTAVSATATIYKFNTTAPSDNNEQIVSVSCFSSQGHDLPHISPTPYLLQRHHSVPLTDTTPTLLPPPPLTPPTSSLPQTTTNNKQRPT